MLAEQDNLDVILNHALDAVDVSSRPSGMRRIERASFMRVGSGEKLTIAARTFIDATYEGDLLARAGVAYRVAREGRDAYGESLAPPVADGQCRGTTSAT